MERRRRSSRGGSRGPGPGTTRSPRPSGRGEVRRVSGLRPGAFLERGGGRAARDRLHHRAAGEGGRAGGRAGASAGRLGRGEQAAIFAQLAPAAVAALTNPLVGATEANTAEWRAAEIPAANGHGTARAVAAL